LADIVSALGIAPTNSKLNRAGQLIELDYSKVEEFAGDPEDAFAQLLELQVRLYFILIEIVFRLANPLGIVTVIPAPGTNNGLAEGRRPSAHRYRSRDIRSPHCTARECLRQQFGQ
jgi:hypothetical protein